MDWIPECNSSMYSGSEFILDLLQQDRVNKEVMDTELERWFPEKKSLGGDVDSGPNVPNCSGLSAVSSALFFR